MQSMIPELIIIATGIGVMLWDLLAGPRRGGASWLAIAGMLAAAGALLARSSLSEVAFGGRFVADPITGWFKLIFLLAGIFTLILAEEDTLESRGEFCTILLFVLAGMMFLASARDIVFAYVSLELATVPLFALAAWTRDARSGEGALKYFIMGALASALLLYGLSLLYGLTGETAFAAIAQRLPLVPLSWLAAGLITAGVGFKLTLFPFHMWAPDAYEGAPTSVAAFLSVGSKATGLVLAFHVFYRIFGAQLHDWSLLFCVLAAITMTLGNIAAITQTNIKRFMAYSSISQAGYLLLGFLGSSEKEITAMVFYLFVYVLTNLAAFSVIVLHGRESGSEEIRSFRGLSHTNPGLALALMIALFGLAGIPPLSGFVGKLFLFNVAAQHGYYWLVAIAAVNSTVSLYYYLGIIRQMYIENDQGAARKLHPSPLYLAGLLASTAGSVLCGLIPFFYNSVSGSVSQWLANFH